MSFNTKFNNITIVEQGLILQHRKKEECEILFLN
jgi:hypothetical protein